MNQPEFPAAPAWTPPPLPTGLVPPPSDPRFRLAVRFTGSGSEYFRIWIVNLLLTLVTLSLYLPWARARRLRYFHGNTVVGDHPLAFHGDPKKMFRGYVLVAIMLALYSVANHFSPGAGFVAFLILAVVWPALMKASLQFRLANTSWRGLRFQFTGTVGGAYASLLPAFVPSMVILALAAMADPVAPPPWLGFAMLGTMLGLLAVAPWLWWRIKKYQHDNYAYAGSQMGLTASVGSFYGVFFKTVGITMLFSIVFGIIASILVSVFTVMGMFTLNLSELDTKSAYFWAMLVTLPLVFLGMFSVYGVSIPYFKTRMQNLVWSQTGNDSVRFQSQLSFGSALKLTLKNWVLIALTLGLYWPFAAVAMARLKLQAMAVQSKVDLDTLIGQAQAHSNDATGDAAGDLFGVDIGL